ncbi:MULTISPECIES: isoamylase early set domain-containing protein [unclassified Lentimicrobium]|uniref:isoamylase early set domain-containing protein n=1 Tax=unclassified Lentimicrobium TaxID=2677434 RepID=UPI001556A821|nr:MULTISPECIES: isoamylase early set domain-containing protein [unclassified Lentimicrobium]NPD44640.1 glycoside hydrolase [Lentimicrobium sp. S6]NPD83352.1 glycoside hydrolase [Lentimicrobium sp. L6]
MSLKKQYLKSKPICKVTFSMDKEAVAGASQVDLLGEFNSWNMADAISMKKLKNGTFKVTVDLPTGSEFQYKYLLDGEKWIADDSADKYVNSGLGAEENAVVVL